MKELKSNLLAKTPKPPYYAVVFSSELNDNVSDYNEMSVKMVSLAKEQKGFLGVESARNEVGITVSYWESLEAIKRWKQHAEHSIARERGRSEWYKAFKVRICKVEKDYGFEL